MKIRKGFISNSSSTAFLITNLTDQEKTLVDFVAETPWIIENYKKMYCNGNCEGMGISQGHLMVSAEENNVIFKPHEEKVCLFGDESGELIGMVYDYMLRGEDISDYSKLLKEPNSKIESEFTGVDSPSFKVRFHEWAR